MALDFPDLSDLRRQGPTHFLNVVFRGSAPRDVQLRALIVNFVRLSDLALDLYEFARTALHEFFEPRNALLISRGMRASGYLEGCVDAIRRAGLFLERIRGDPRFSVEVRRLLKGTITHKPLVLVPGPSRQIQGMRNAIQHLEEKILRRTIAEGEAFALSVTHDGRGFELLENRVSFHALASWTQELNALSGVIATYVGEWETKDFSSVRSST